MGTLIKSSFQGSWDPLPLLQQSPSLLLSVIYKTVTKMLADEGDENLAGTTEITVSKKLECSVPHLGMMFSYSWFPFKRIK